MGSEWPSRMLKDCAKWYSGGTPSKSKPELWNGKIPWISAKSLTNFFLSDSEDKVTSEAIGNGTRLVPKGSILFVVRGMSLKKEFRLGIAERPVAFNQDIKALVSSDGIESNYLAYAIKAKSSEILALVEEAGHGTGVLPTSQIQSIQIPIPPIFVQRQVSGLLRAIDDQITLNNQINITLESMAQALFKSWFVDFDPVIDNALAAGNSIPESLKARAETRAALGDQRRPLPDHIRQEFPDRFVVSEEMGWVPEGWKIAPLSQIAALKTQSAHPGREPDKVWTHFSIPAFDDEMNPSYDLGETIKSGKYEVPKTAILASKLNPQFPRIWMPDVADENSSVCSTEFMPFVPKDPAERPYIYSLFCSDIMQSEISNRVTGSTGSRQRVKPKEIAELPVLTPSQSLRLAFCDIACSFFEKKSVVQLENLALQKLRDTLLPKLLSGELRVPEAERKLEEVAL